MTERSQNSGPEATSQLHSAMVCLAATCYGLITVGGRYFSEAGFSLFEISFLIAFVPFPLVPWLMIRPELRISRQQIGFFLIFGIIGGALQLAQFASIVLGMPVAMVALLLYTQPVWTILLSRLFLAEPITSRKLLALAVAGLGTFVLLEPWSQTGHQNKWGILAGLAAGLLLSLWVIWGRLSSLRCQHFVTSTFGYTSFSALVLLLAYPLLVRAGADSSELMRFRPSIYLEQALAVTLFTVIAGLLPACLVFAGLKRLDASRAGLLMLLEPVSAAVAARIAFTEPLTAGIYLGGGLILLANYLQWAGRKGPRFPLNPG